MFVYTSNNNNNNIISSSATTTTGRTMVFLPQDGTSQQKNDFSQNDSKMVNDTVVHENNQIDANFPPLLSQNSEKSSSSATSCISVCEILNVPDEKVFNNNEDEEQQLQQQQQQQEEENIFCFRNHHQAQHSFSKKKTSSFSNNNDDDGDNDIKHNMILQEKGNNEDDDSLRFRDNDIKKTSSSLLLKPPTPPPGRPPDQKKNISTKNMESNNNSIAILKNNNDQEIISEASLVFTTPKNEKRSVSVFLKKEKNSSSHKSNAKTDVSSLSFFETLELSDETFNDEDSLCFRAPSPSPTPTVHRGNTTKMLVQQQQQIITPLQEQSLKKNPNHVSFFDFTPEEGSSVTPIRLQQRSNKLEEEKSEDTIYDYSASGNNWQQCHSNIDESNVPWNNNNVNKNQDVDYYYHQQQQRQAKSLRNPSDKTWLNDLFKRQAIFKDTRPNQHIADRGSRLKQKKKLSSRSMKGYPINDNIIDGTTKVPAFSEKRATYSNGKGTVTILSEALCLSNGDKINSEIVKSNEKENNDNNTTGEFIILDESVKTDNSNKVERKFISSSTTTGSNDSRSSSSNSSDPLSSSNKKKTRSHSEQRRNRDRSSSLRKDLYNDRDRQHHECDEKTLVSSHTVTTTKSNRDRKSTSFRKVLNNNHSHRNLMEHDNTTLVSSTNNAHPTKSIRSRDTISRQSSSSAAAATTDRLQRGSRIHKSRQGTALEISDNEKVMACKKKYYQSQPPTTNNKENSGDNIICKKERRKTSNRTGKKEIMEEKKENPVQKGKRNEQHSRDCKKVTRCKSMHAIHTATKIRSKEEDSPMIEKKKHDINLVASINVQPAATEIEKRSRDCKKLTKCKSMHAICNTTRIRSKGEDSLTIEKKKHDINLAEIEKLEEKSESNRNLEKEEDNHTLEEKVNKQRVMVDRKTRRIQLARKRSQKGLLTGISCERSNNSKSERSNNSKSERSNNSKKSCNNKGNNQNNGSEGGSGESNSEGKKHFAPPATVVTQPITNLDQQNDNNSEINLVSSLLSSLNDDPEEILIDKITFMPLEDPVLLSSGFAVSRTTAIKNNKLRFDTCPFSREPLKQEVYPIHFLRDKVTEWQKLQLGTCLQLAEILVNESKWEISEEVFQKSKGIIDGLGNDKCSTIINKILKFEVRVPTIKAARAVEIYKYLINSSSSDNEHVIQEAAEKGLQEATEMMDAVDCVMVDHGTDYISHLLVDVKAWLSLYHVLARAGGFFQLQVPWVEQYLRLAKFTNIGRDIRKWRKVMVGIYDNDGNYGAKELFLEREGIKVEGLGISINYTASTLLNTCRKKYGEVKQTPQRVETRLERSTRRRKRKEYTETM